MGRRAVAMPVAPSFSRARAGIPPEPSAGTWCSSDAFLGPFLIGRALRMTIGTILIIILSLLLIGAIPSWPYSRGWGYGPSGGLGVILVILLVLVLLGRI
jgi:hypothetical protein